MPSLLDRLRHTLPYRLAKFLRHMVVRTQHRHTAWLELCRPREMFQPYPTTSENRYPRTFAFVRDLIGDGADRTLLSFGCASGEEVFTLRQYFPLATICGQDINRRCITQCRQRLAALGGDDKIRFIEAGRIEAAPFDSFDAIFAMAVFRHGGLKHAPPSCRHFLRFADFERHLEALTQRIKPGGVLVIQHANFRFTDSLAAAGFQRLFPGEAPVTGRHPPLYDRNDRLMPDAEPDDGVYQKISGQHNQSSSQPQGNKTFR